MRPGVERSRIDMNKSLNCLRLSSPCLPAPVTKWNFILDFGIKTTMSGLSLIPEDQSKRIFANSDPRPDLLIDTWPIMILWSIVKFESHLFSYTFEICRTSFGDQKTRTFHFKCLWHRCLEFIVLKQKSILLHEFIYLMFVSREPLWCNKDWGDTTQGDQCLEWPSVSDTWAAQRQCGEWGASQHLGECFITVRWLRSLISFQD